ncbi:aldose epimerase family protein [Halobacillus mangrovi]|uniref:aldose epimerase family protein n=1 Tax=Halobacillus mangrovi TaxID=402384 RepID=UPI003D98FA48
MSRLKIQNSEVQVKGNQTWNVYRLVNDQGMYVEFINYGGIITDISVPDRNGNKENVVLAFKNHNDYLDNPIYFGALIGRVAGRIKQSSFEINGQNYQLDPNEGDNHLHGGKNGFHSRIWEVSPYETEEEVGAKLSMVSPDGDGGYPGQVKVEVTYTLTNDNKFIISYEASSDKTTPLTLTNHTYFNLSGNNKRTLEDQELCLDSSKMVELDKELIPTGKWLDVTDSPFDFRDKKKLESVFTYETPQQKIANGGMDHFFKFDKHREVDVYLEDPKSGRTLSIETDQPGIVIYTSNSFPEGIELAEGKPKKHAGLCFETQSSPASLHEVGFPNIILDKEQSYSKRTIFTFGIQ